MLFQKLIFLNVNLQSFYALIKLRVYKFKNICKIFENLLVAKIFNVKSIRKTIILFNISTKEKAIPRLVYEMHRRFAKSKKNLYL